MAWCFSTRASIAPVLSMHLWPQCVKWVHGPMPSMPLLSLRLRQDDCHFADNIFNLSVFLNENVFIWLKISLKFVPKVRINNIPALIQIMAWRRSGDKPLPEPMIVSLLMHICATRPQWVNRWLWYWKLVNKNVANISCVFYITLFSHCPKTLFNHVEKWAQMMVLYIQSLSRCIAVHAVVLWPLLLTWFNFNPSMDK